MPEDNENEASKSTTTRRSQLKRELDAFAELVRILKPLSQEQRTRLVKAANELLPPE